MKSDNQRSTDIDHPEGFKNTPVLFRQACVEPLLPPVSIAHLWCLSTPANGEI